MDSDYALEAITLYNDFMSQDEGKARFDWITKYQEGVPVHLIHEHMAKWVDGMRLYNEANKPAPPPKIYSYFVTFTTRSDTRDGSEFFLKTQARRERLEIQKFVYTVEHPQDNLHFHAYIQTRKPMVKSAFKQWINTRGNIDFKPVKAGTEGDVLSYMSKESTPVVLV